MTEIPSWVVTAAGIFFVLNSLLFLALIVASFRFVQLLNDLKPRIENVEQSLQDLVKKVQDVTVKVERLTESLQQRVTDVGGKAQGIAHSAEHVVLGLSKQFEKISPVVVGAVTMIRIYKAIKGGRQKKGILAKVRGK